MTAKNPKSAVLDAAFYDLPDTVLCYETLQPLLLAELQPQQDDLVFTAHDLSLLTCQLQQFQQDYLGIHPHRPNNAPLRLPSRLFRIHHGQPLNKHSPLYNILLAAYEYRINKGWKQWDFHQPSKKSKYVDLFQYIRTSLLEKRVILPVKIAFADSTPEAARKTLTAMAWKMGVQVTDSVTTATHILYGPLHQYNQVEEEWLRTLERENGKVLVHWWYYPDSYDSWLVQTDQFADPEDPPNHKGPWHISSRWLQDSAKFNELMNEEDYEIDTEEGSEAEAEVKNEADNENTADNENGDETENENEEGEVMEETEVEAEVEAEVEVEEEVEEEEVENTTNSNTTDIKAKLKKEEEEENTDLTVKEEEGEEEEEEEDTDMAVKEEEEEEEDEEEEEEEIRHHCSKEEGLDHKRKMSESHSIKDTFMPSLSYDMSSSPSLPIPVMNASHQPSVRIRDIERERPQLGSRQRKNEFEPYSNGDITNISQYTETFIEYPKRPAKIMRLEDTYKMTEEGIDIHPLISSMPIDYTVLHSPQWFDIHSVHAIEKLGLPEFFSVPSEETEKEYKKYRDFMVHTYRAHPDYYLTVAACKAKLDADLVLLIRLHSFLELYGLINAQVDPRRRIVDPYVDSDPDAGIKLKSQRDYRNSQPVDMQHLRDLIYNASLTVDKKSGWDLAIQDGTNPDAKTIYACTTCQTDCSLIRYQCLKHKQVHVCIDCFLEGRFTSVLSSGDFLRVESGSDRYTMEEEWGSMETLRLLEAVERYDDDWLMISEHVGSRSKEQCITHFLQLPISDAFLTAQLENKELEELPFGSQPNPVMTMIAFLSGHINPGVGAAAAKAAIKELLQSKEGQQDTSMHMEEEEDEEMEEMEEEEMEEEEMESHGQEEKDIKEEEIDIEVDPSHRLEDMDTSQDTSQENPSLPKEAFLPDTLKKATLAALWSAVDQAKKLASYEDQEIHHWTRLAVKTLVDKLLLKVQQYSELETSLDSEYKELKKQGLVLTSSIEALVRQYTPHPIAPPMALPTHTLGGESTSQPITIQTSTETPAEAAP